jgi:acyl dehydratase
MRDGGKGSAATPDADMTMLYFEDFAAGQAMPRAECIIAREDALAFATAFDPQPCHLDEVAGEASLLAGLSVSGWQTAALGMRLMYESFIGRTASLGAPGIDHLRWRKPVRPGDRLVLDCRVVETRASRSRLDMGLVSVDFSLANQAGECVMSENHVLMVRRRSAAAAEGDCDV